MDTRTCVYCQASFSPNKYSKRQKVCSNPDCQKKRQRDSMKVWRERNPNYFKYDESKGLAWLETQRKRSKVWRQSNPEKVRSYRKEHLSEYREYMRDYMRRYREKKKMSSPGEPPSPPPAQTDSGASSS